MAQLRIEALTKRFGGHDVRAVRVAGAADALIADFTVPQLGARLLPAS